MEKRPENLAAAIGMDKDLAEKLDRLMQNPGDRAYVICSANSCSNNAKGQCTIYTVLDEHHRLANGKCSRSTTV